MGRRSRTKYPTYRFHRASGQAVVTLDGRDFYLGTYRSQVSRNEFDRIVGEWLQNGRRLPEPDGRFTITVNELMVNYLDFADGYYRSNGKRTTEYTAIKYALGPVMRLYGLTLAREFGPLALKTCRDQYLKAGQARQKINQNVGRVKRLFKWGVENEVVPPDVFHGLQAVVGLKRGRTEAPENKPVRPVPQEDIDAVLPHLPKMVADMVQVHLLTGMRPGELVKLCGDELETDGRVWVFRPENHKTAHHGHKRPICIGPRAQWVLGQYVLKAGNGFVFSPRRSEERRNAERRQNRQTPMTPSQRKRKAKKNPKRTARERYTVDSYRRAIQRACKKAGVPSWHPHQLRHNAATNITKDFGLEAARVVLGHKSLSVTDIYAERDEGAAARVMEAVG